MIHILYGLRTDTYKGHVGTAAWARVSADQKIYKPGLMFSWTKCGHIFQNLEMRAGISGRA